VSKNAVNLSLYLSYILPMSAYHMQNFYHILSTKILYTFLIIHTHAWCSTHLTLLALTVLIQLDEENHQVPQHKNFLQLYLLRLSDVPYYFKVVLLLLYKKYETIMVKMLLIWKSTHN